MTLVKIGGTYINMALVTDVITKGGGKVQVSFVSAWGSSADITQAYLDFEGQEAQDLLRWLYGNSVETATYKEE